MAKLVEESSNENFDHDVTPVKLEMKKTRPGQFIDTRAFSRKRDILKTSNCVLG